ncbi:type VI secretion system baseplate subunit TssF [Roseateles sp. BYS87W]|uniref:Type VI secretion system baseplate subunit TssF n=1 Tax=Pelomonas baiyunensis TaxID=3299026 RepID=A0ABW7H5E4_9BURK
MRDLLPYFERELALLGEQAQDFAKTYPRIAGRLSTSGNLLEDPHVERLVQSFALLSARVHKRLDDDFPRVTESLLEVLYPHYLRPFPSCSVACFDMGSRGSPLTSAARVPRGSLLKTRPVSGVPCQFTTAAPLDLTPVQVRAARWVGACVTPDGTPVPAGATSLLSVELELRGSQARWSDLGVPALRVFLDADMSLATALRDALTGHALGALVQHTPVGPWAVLPAGVPQTVGFVPDEALLPFDDRSAHAYRLLTEYFAFPEKFNFIDLPLPRVQDGAEALPARITLHYPMSGLRSDGDAARLLETLAARHLRLHCVPVVNRFKAHAEPIRITHAQAEYPVLPDARRAFAYEVYSIDRVYRVRQSPRGDEVQEFRPFFGLHHEVHADTAQDATPGLYWHARRDDAVAETAPGHETEITLVDTDFDPAEPQVDTLSLDVTATNRELPNQISIGQPGGDVFMEGSLASEITLLRKPTRPLRFERGQGALWRLVSHLSLNHLTLGRAGLDGLKELLRLYDLPRASTGKRIVDGLVALDTEPAVAWMPGEPFATFVRGVNLRLQVDREAFVGSGLHLFAQLLEQFFGLYVQVNSFTQLTLLCHRTGEVLVTGRRLSGEQELL